MQINIGIAAILLAFYLYLLVRKDGISRPLFFWIGLGGVALAAIAGTLPTGLSFRHSGLARYSGEKSIRVTS